MRSPSDFFQRLNIAGGSIFNGNETEERLLSADVQLSMEQEGEISFALRDPNFEFFKSFGDKGPNNVDATYDRHLLRVAGYRLDDGPDGMGKTTLKMRPRGIQRCRSITGPLTREALSASQFVADSAINCGMKWIVQDSSQRPSISRDIPEGDSSTKEERNEWTTLKRLANEEGFVIFEVYNTLYFATPQWLFDRMPNHSVGWRNADVEPNMRMVEAPSAYFTTTKSNDDDVVFRLPISAAGFILPGHTVTFKGLPFLKDKLLVSEISYPLAGIGDFEITAKKPWIVEKTTDQKKYKTSGDSGQTFGPRGTGADFYAKEIIAAAKERNLGRDGARNGIATALVETNLRMYANSKVPASLGYPHDAVGSDGTSCGLFQQQQNGAWGTLAENMNARASAGLFFNAMMKFDWRAMDPGAACQRVQRSAFPGRYSERMGEAMTYVNRLY